MSPFVFFLFLAGNIADFRVTIYPVRRFDVRIAHRALRTTPLYMNCRLGQVFFVSVFYVSSAP
jgi:hypothetical protein